MKKREDAVLVKDYINGNERALEVLVNRHQLRIFNFIFSKVRDREVTEDIFQDTFIKVINTLKNGKYNEEGKFLPWVMRISYNLLIDYFRKNKRIPKFESSKEEFDIFDILGNGEQNIEDSMIKDQIVNEVRRLVEELPEDQKEVLIMRLYKDLSFKEIAENTDVSINTALGRMRYAVINLRKLIEKHQVVLIS
jgi:RNA polymerase sigma-70 factor (ECF subfamily)